MINENVIPSLQKYGMVQKKINGKDTAQRGVEILPGVFLRSRA